MSSRHDKKPTPIKFQQHGCLNKTGIMTPGDIPMCMGKDSQGPTAKCRATGKSMAAEKGRIRLICYPIQNGQP